MLTWDTEWIPCAIEVYLAQSTVSKLCEFSMVLVAGFQVTLPPAACQPYQIHAHIQHLHREGADSQVTIRFCLPQSLLGSAKECASLPPLLPKLAA